jgi:hypothetical protein
MGAPCSSQVEQPDSSLNLPRTPPGCEASDPHYPLTKALAVRQASSVHVAHIVKELPFAVAR